MSGKFGRISLEMRVKKRKSGAIYEDEELLSGLVAEPALAYEHARRGPMSLLGVAPKEGEVHNQQVYFLQVIRGGLPRYSLDKLMEVTGLNIYEMAQILDTTDRTLRRHDGHVKLSREHSERALEIAQLYSRGEEVFGSLEVFRQWMDASVPALGGQKPRTFLDTSLGISMLLQTLGRIEHGVFA